MIDNFFLDLLDSFTHQFENVQISAKVPFTKVLPEDLRFQLFIALSELADYLRWLYTLGRNSPAILRGVVVVVDQYELAALCGFTLALLALLYLRYIRSRNR